MIIELDHIAKKFKNEWIFKNLSFTLNSGNYYAIVGHNGSGKSTLLSVISGIMPPSQGKVHYLVNDKEIHGDDAYKNISYAAPYMDLIEELTLEECLTFHLKFRSLNDGISFSDFFELAQLSAHKNKYINQFSSGMKQRLKLSLCFFSQSKCMLLDEPTTNLDEQGVAWYRSNVQTFSQDKIVIVSSNDKSEYDFCEERIDITKFKV